VMNLALLTDREHFVPLLFYGARDVVQRLAFAESDVEFLTALHFR